MPNRLTIMFFSSAFPIHPPEGANDPWNVEFPPDCGYKARCEKGVYKVFRTEEDMNNNKPLNYEVSQMLLTLYILTKSILDCRIGAVCDRYPASVWNDR